jgi:hypothetical protein
LNSVSNISPDQTPGQILQTFYKEHELPPDGGISESHVTAKLTKKITFYLPNLPSRKIAVLKHDIHHMLTGYSTLFKGETEISAWEIGGGVRHYWMAWILDIGGMMSGLVFNLGGVFRAFVRGRHSINLYSDLIDNKTILDMPISEILKVIKIPPQNEKIKASLGDIFSFLWNLFLGGVYSITSIILVPFLIVYNIVMYIKLS